VRFVGRERELERLRSRLEEVRRGGRGAFISMRGRRRVGKSRLVDEFVRGSGCPHVFYTAVQGSSARELDRFLLAVGDSDAPAADLIRAGAGADTWEAALRLTVRDASQGRPLIVVIDEFPYLVDKDPSIEAVLQAVWDRTVQGVPVLLILIGSDVATMEALTQSRRPLYDRPREMVVEPLSPAAIGGMLGLSAADAFDAYLIIGGFPVLALEWGAGRSRRSYLAETLDDPSSFLVLSAERALAAEFPAAAHPRVVLNAVGSELRANKELLQRTQMNNQTLGGALDVLVGKRVVERRTPYSSRAAPQTKQYVVNDPYMRFWLGFIGPNMDLIERGRGHVLAAGIEERWLTYRGRAIEPIVRDALERRLPAPPFGDARYVGDYWTRNHAVQVDLVGGDKRPVAKSVSFLGSIKWRERSPFSRTDTVELAAGRGQVPGADASTRLVGVSRAGFGENAGVDVELGPEDLLDVYRA
jgi:AAA+ ATPase superfamily predicted ATPase